MPCSHLLALFLFLIENIPEKPLSNHATSKYLKGSTQDHTLQETKKKRKKEKTQKNLLKLSLIHI